MYNDIKNYKKTSPIQKNDAKLVITCEISNYMDLCKNGQKGTFTQYSWLVEWVVMHEL